MKAVVLNAIGAPMAVEEIPTPEPRASGADATVEASSRLLSPSGSL